MTILIAFGFGSCKDDAPNNNAQAFDPSQPVTISDFIPKTGGVGQRLLVYGRNFGNDTAIVAVFVGGKKARLISVKGESLYCIVPERAYGGELEISVGGTARVKAAQNFEYQRKMVVSTLCGYRNERDDQGWRDGPFKGSDDSRAAGFRNASFMKFDPKNPKHLYISYDGYHVNLLDFGDSAVTTPITRGSGNWDRFRSVDFTVDGEYMILSNDQGGENDISSSILSRRNGTFGDPQVLTRYKQCNGASVHPVNGELYFNSYERGQFFRFDLLDARFFGGSRGEKDYVELFKIQDIDWEFNIQIHPSGNYAYIVVINKHYILRTDYNWKTRAFMNPYVVCGEARTYDYVDGVGTNARLRDPYQGVFVKNPEYAGKDDEYDFYFTERHNHDIRILTPEGKVTTFAGRGSSSLNPDPWGYVEGDLRAEARFNQPTGLAYNEAEKAFYVGDTDNRRIRKIAMEDLDDDDDDDD
jgi:hypothetical protein